MLLQEFVVVVVVVRVVDLLVVHLTLEETDFMIQRMEKGLVGFVDTAKVVVGEVNVVDLPMVELVMGGSSSAVVGQVVGKLSF